MVMFTCFKTVHGFLCLVSCATGVASGITVTTFVQGLWLKVNFLDRQSDTLAVFTRSMAQTVPDMLMFLY